MPSIHLHKAIATILSGDVLAYPTEAVWGLGCDPFDREAVMRILALKQRPWQKGLLLVGGDREMFRPLLNQLPGERRIELEASWPGPNTWVVPDTDIYPEWVRGQHKSVAIRVTAHPLVAELTRKLGYPIISTSANPAGLLPARTLFQCRRYFGNNIGYYLPGPLGGQSQPTRIRDALTGDVFRA